MPRTRSLAWAELKVGLVSVLAIVIAAVVIFLLSGEGGFFWERYTLKAQFDDVAGLKAGAPVRVAGVEVGSVGDVQFAGNRVDVIMEVGRDHQARITDRSVASLGSVSLLGEGAVDITASSEGSPIPEWGYVKTGPAAGSIAEVTGQATVGLQEATKLIQEIRAGKGSVGKLFTDETLYAEINRFVDAAEDVARQVSRGQGTLGRLARDPAAAKALEGSLQNLEAVTGRIRAGEGSLGRLLQDDAFSKSLTSTAAHLDTLTARLNKGEGTAGKLMTDDSLFNRLNAMSERVDKVVALLQEGQGTAGQLLHDKQLYENMNGAVGELRNLLKQIQADPKKYLNVRVSLF